MSASKLNLPSIEKGATYRHTLFWKDSLNAAINLTNCTAKLQVRETLLSSILLELSTENGGLTITPLLGKIDLYVSSATSTLLEGLGGVYDLEIYYTNGDTVRLVEGKLKFVPEVTR